MKTFFRVGLLFVIPVAVWCLAGAAPAAARDRGGNSRASGAERCESQPGFRGLDRITVLVENEAVEQEAVLQKLKLTTRPVPPPPATKTEDARRLILRFLRENAPRLDVATVLGEFQPPMAALAGSESLLQARLDIVERSGELWEQRVDLFFYRRVKIEQTGERLWGVVWQTSALVHTSEEGELPQTVKKTLLSLLQEFACRYRKGGDL